MRLSAVGHLDFALSDLIPGHDHAPAQHYECACSDCRNRTVRRNLVAQIAQQLEILLNVSPLSEMCRRFNYFQSDSVDDRCLRCRAARY
jgi:hypothetical protein